MSYSVAYLFTLHLDADQLEGFTKVEGLGVKYETETVKEGGQNTHTHLLPVRVSYDNIKLTRPVGAGTTDLAAWFTRLQQNVASGKMTKRQTASITAHTAESEPIASWSLLDVYPVSYRGPSFETGKSNLITEVLELAHNGFWSITGQTRPPVPAISQPSVASTGGGPAGSGPTAAPGGASALEAVQEARSRARNESGRARGQANRARGAAGSPERSLGGLM